ncbi:TonB-dependent siderophore receptor [Pseudomonas sp. MYb185]|uniref:TonB-dependent receptor plug domain-containing protein n=1 Tax=Pseudomonas sp. MYb185 TaxID=1848729 RepID=UPI000CFD0127|nr:TonB-dependent receptor [Pseudomonas sp. MYb185]PRB83740.1 hypothetical protein CQ007_02565 [Pseudomonas sp. MYb185]
MKARIFIGGLSLLSLSVAQAALDGPSVRLADTVITGTGFEVASLMSPGSVTRIGEDDLRRRSLADVADLFRDIPGVVLSDSDTPGMKRISIRGESSRRVTIRIDGQTVTDHTDYGTPLLIDPAMIERVEVVRGPASVINGSNAIGGVVNIITRRGSDVPLESYVGGGYYSATQGYRSNAGLSGSSGGFDYRLGLSRSEHGDRRTRGHGELDNSAYDNQSAALHLGYRRDNHYVAFKAERFDLSAGSWVEPQPGSEFNLDFPKRDQRHYALFYEATDLNPVVKKLSANAYRRTVDRDFNNNVLTRVLPVTVMVDNNSLDEQLTRGLGLQAELELFSEQTTLIGLEYMDDELDSDKFGSTTRITPAGTVVTPASASQKADQQTLSAFAQQEWQFAESWTAYLGGRYYRVESELARSTERTAVDSADERVLGSLGIVYSPAPHWALRANLAQGYSYPTLAQLYSVSPARERIFYGNPDLKPERARVVELGWRYEVPLVTTDVVLFHTIAKDYIDRQRIGATPDGYLPPGNSALEQWQYTNVNEANTTGLEVSLEWRPDWLVQPHAALSLSRREFDYGNGYSTRDSGLPAAMGTLGLRSYAQLGQVSNEFDFFVRTASGAERKGADRSVEDREGGYATLNLAWTLDYQERVGVRLLLGNLLNRSYRPLDELPGLKRHIDTEITLTF